MFAYKYWIKFRLLSILHQHKYRQITYHDILRNQYFLTRLKKKYYFISTIWIWSIVLSWEFIAVLYGMVTRAFAYKLV